MKYLYFILLSALLIQCNSDENLLNNPNFGNEKIKKITILDQDIDNGNLQTYEQYDLSFSYYQNILANVNSSNGNFSENQSYTNGFLSNITLTENIYGVNSFFKRNLITNTGNKLQKTVAVDLDIYGQRRETHYEYPNNNIIIVKEVLLLPNGNEVLTDQTKKIYFVNENVQKIEYYNINNNSLLHIDKFEYDNKINPNSKIAPNRILADPIHSYVPYILRNYSQLSKNNVVKYSSVDVFGNQEVEIGKYDITYTYDAQTNLPITQSYIILDSNTSTFGSKITATYEYQ